MTTRKAAVAIWIGGILWFAFMLRMPDLVTIPGIGPFQPDPTRQNWVNAVLEMVYKVPGAVLSYLMVLTLISIPIGIYLRLARRRAALKHPSTPAPHGKYVP